VEKHTRKKRKHCSETQTIPNSRKTRELEQRWGNWQRSRSDRRGNERKSTLREQNQQITLFILAQHLNNTDLYTTVT